MTEKEVKIQQERIEKFNKLKKELTPYKDMIKFIDNFSNSYKKLIIGITCDECYKITARKMRGLQPRL